MTPAPDAATKLRAKLVNTLTDQGVLTDPAWRDAFATVPREAFVPRFARREHGGQLVHYGRTDDRTTKDFLAAVYSDASLITQFNAAGIATSSSTQPSLMAIMLERLDVHDGDTVLEIGTGTGYNAALLTHRLRDETVTTIDVDLNVVIDAENALTRTGYRPTVKLGNGAEGVPDRAPFDRIIATCGVPRIPKAWINQTRPGGKILANTGLALIQLTVTADGIATGHFDNEPAAFMPLRHDPDDAAQPVGDVLAITHGNGDTHPTAIPEDLDHPVVEFLLELILPEVQRITLHTDPTTHVLVDPTSVSWAKTQAEVHAAKVTEHGPRLLWNELLNVIAEWTDLGQPKVTDYALTIDANGTHHLSHPESGWSLTLS